MKLHFDRDWIRRKIETSDIEEPCVIGTSNYDAMILEGMENTMSENALVECWVAGKIEDLQVKIESEMSAIRERNGDDSDSIFSNMGNTSTLKLASQIEVLKELEEFLDGLDT